MKNLILVLLLLSVSVYAAPRSFRIDPGVHPIFGTVTDGGADTLNLIFSSSKQFQELYFTLNIDTVTGGGTDSALVLANYFGEDEISGATPSGKKLTYSIESLQALSAPDTLWWKDATGTSVKYIDYADNGWSHFVPDLEVNLIARSSILQIIIRDGNLAAAGTNSFDYVLEVDAKK